MLNKKKRDLSQDEQPPAEKTVKKCRTIFLKICSNFLSNILSSIVRPLTSHGPRVCKINQHIRIKVAEMFSDVVAQRRGNIRSFHLAITGSIFGALLRATAQSIGRGCRSYETKTGLQFQLGAKSQKLQIQMGWHLSENNYEPLTKENYLSKIVISSMSYGQIHKRISCGQTISQVLHLVPPTGSNS